MPINWGMGLMPDIGQNALAAFERGRAQRKQDEYQKAAQVYAQNPTEANYNALIPFSSPDQAVQLGVQRQQQQQAQHAETMKSIGQAALDVMTSPEAERAAKWDAYVREFAKSDPTAMQSLGGYSPDAAMALIAHNGLMGAYQQRTDPKYMAIPYLGRLVNTRDPNAVSQFGEQTQPDIGKHMVAGQALQLIRDMGNQPFIEWQQKNNLPVKLESETEFNALPPGALFIGPDGIVRKK